MASYDVASIVCQALGRGVTRSKRAALRWLRMAAENGYVEACYELARDMYLNLPYAREIGRLGEAAVVAGVDWGGVTAAFRQAHDVPPDVLTSVMYWSRKGYELGALISAEAAQDTNAAFVNDDVEMVRDLVAFRKEALQGSKYCRNEGCEVVGLLKDFKVCPQCKTARYCGTACQKQDWNAGAHKESCCTSAPHNLSDDFGPDDDDDDDDGAVRDLE